MHDLRMIGLMFDMFTVAHMAAFSVGIGCAVFVEVAVFRRFHNGIDQACLALLKQAHCVIGLAVVALWVSGLGLLAIRLGILDGILSAKLILKLAVVVGLTLNMWLIDAYVLPRLDRLVGMRLDQIPKAQLVSFGAIAGASAGCWLSALLLGGVGAFKIMAWSQLLGFFLPVLGGAAVSGAVLAAIFGRKPAMPDPSDTLLGRLS